MRRNAKPEFLAQSFFIDLDANSVWQGVFLMLDQLPIIVQPSIRPHHPPCEEYCTVVFRLQGGRSAMGWFLAELSRHFEGSGTAEIVKFEVGDHLHNRR